jgi:hypothetical protein
MKRWAENIKTVEEELIKLAIIAANNHYAGFGPGTANIFRNILGCQKPSGRIEEKNKNKKQVLSMTWT